MKLNSMNCLSSSSERESAVFTFFSPSFVTREGKQNKTHNLSLCFSWSKQRPFKSNLEPTMKHLHVWLPSTPSYDVSNKIGPLWPALPFRTSSIHPSISQIIQSYSRSGLNVSWKEVSHPSWCARRKSNSQPL